MSTRAHILDERTMMGRCREEPYAIYERGHVRVQDPTGDSDSVLVLNARQARQLAYQLCEAADAAERSKT